MLGPLTAVCALAGTGATWLAVRWTGRVVLSDVLLLPMFAALAAGFLGMLFSRRLYSLEPSDE